MTITIYTSNSGYNVLNKNFVSVATVQNVEFIKPTDLVNPVITLKPDSRVVEGNYIYFDGFGAYYQIRSVTTEHNRMIAECHRDPLTTYYDEILLIPNVIMERATKKNIPNYFLPDDEIDILSFPYIETHPLTLKSGTPFSNSKNNYILALTGGVTASTNNQSQGGNS